MEKLDISISNVGGEVMYINHRPTEIRPNKYFLPVFSLQPQET